MKFFSRMLSSAGSKSSPTSSINSGRPRDRLSSKWFLKYLWFSEVIWEMGVGQLPITGHCVFLLDEMFLYLSLDQVLVQKSVSKCGQF